MASLAPPGAITAPNSSGGMCSKIPPAIIATNHLEPVLPTTTLLNFEKRRVHQVAGRFQLKTLHRYASPPKAAIELEATVQHL